MEELNPVVVASLVIVRLGLIPILVAWWLVTFMLMPLAFIIDISMGGHWDNGIPLELGGSMKEMVIMNFLWQAPYVATDWWFNGRERMGGWYAGRH